MRTEKKYYNIREVSQMLNLKEHVIRHWDSVDPKTNKFRIENLSIRTKGGTRFFSKTHIKRIENLKNVLIQNGKRNHTLELASKIISKRNSNEDISVKSSADSIKKTLILSKISVIAKNLKSLINDT